MDRKWKRIAAEMEKQRQHYLKIRSSEYRSVHKTLIWRALPLLAELVPEAETFYSEDVVDAIINETCRPDDTGDYEKGAGRHYYCGSNSLGMRLKPFCGYYRNGIWMFSKSARTMLEEDYTMALTSWMSGYEHRGAQYLGRAIHMAADITCLPHATRMTYKSRFGKLHEAYEDLARAMYPDSVEKQPLTEEQLSLFADRSGFEVPLNSIVEAQVGEYVTLKTDAAASIKKRLHTAEGCVAALLLRFMEDTRLSPEEAHYVTDGMKAKVFSDLPPVDISVREEGIRFMHEGEPLSVGDHGDVFRIAHRKGGKFTISPVNDEKGRVLHKNRRRLVRFRPFDSRIFFNIVDIGGNK